MNSEKPYKDNEFGVSQRGAIEFSLQNENGKESYSFDHINNYGSKEIHFKAEKHDLNENQVERKRQLEFGHN